MKIRHPAALRATASTRQDKAADGRRQDRELPPGALRLPVLLSLLQAAGVCFAGSPATLPTCGTISQGSATISQNGRQMTIDQTSPNVAINWTSFNIAPGATVQFVQPGASSIALNRVLAGGGISEIFGTLRANGQVFLLNPSGAVFSSSAQVDVGGLVASSLDLSDADFAAGRRNFSGSAASGAVTNRGSIQAAPGGYVALLAPEVRNEGIIVANRGAVALAAGEAVTLDFQGSQLINLAIDRGAMHALAENGQLIEADGGTVVMTARAASALAGSVVNNSGVIQAQTLDNHNGTIRLLADANAGTVAVSGVLDAGAAHGGNGGSIETSAGSVQVAAGAHVSTAAAAGAAGRWLIDPTDFTIAPSGGDISGATLSGALAGGSVILQAAAGKTGTGGNVNVDDVVSWSANLLTLSASNNININRPMNGSGSASLALLYGQGAPALGNAGIYKVAAPVTLPAGQHFQTRLGSDGTLVNYTVITQLGNPGSNSGTDLQGVAGNPAGNYALGTDIDAAATASWNGGAGFAPLGNPTQAYAGQFAGLGHTVSHLMVGTPVANVVGLFGVTSATATISDLTVADGSVTGHAFVGGLVGINAGTLRASGTTGMTVVGATAAGGVAGTNSGTITGSYAATDAAGGSVSGTGNDAHAFGVGGLVGSSTGTISASSASLPVTNAGTDTGGLLGENTGGLVVGSHASGVVSGNSAVGGLVGANDAASINPAGTISASSASGSVIGASLVGGLVGQNGAYVDTSSASGSVTGLTLPAASGSGQFLGGLIGLNSGNVANAFAVGPVAAPAGGNDYGGLIGANYGQVAYTYYAQGTVTGGASASHGGGLIGASPAGSVTSSYWDAQASGQAGSAGGTAVNVGNSVSSPNQMLLASTYAGFDFGSNWVIYNGHTDPLLKVQLLPVTVTANSVGATYSGQAFSGSAGISLSTGAAVSGTLVYAGSSQGAVNAGSYAILASGLWSTTYAISYAPGTLTINPAPLTLTANSISKPYGTALSFTGSEFSSAGLVDGQTITGVTLASAGASATSHVAGSPYAITIGTPVDSSGSGFDPSNYAITPVNGSLTVLPRPIVVTVSNQARPAGSGNPTSGPGVVGPGSLVFGDTLAAVTESSTLSTTAAPGASAPLVGTGIHVTGGSNASVPGDYAVSFVNGTLTVAAASGSGGSGTGTGTSGAGGSGTGTGTSGAGGSGTGTSGGGTSTGAAGGTTTTLAGTALPAQPDAGTTLLNTPASGVVEGSSLIADSDGPATGALALNEGWYYPQATFGGFPSFVPLTSVVDLVATDANSLAYAPENFLATVQARHDALGSLLQGALDVLRGDPAAADLPMCPDDNAARDLQPNDLCMPTPDQLAASRDGPPPGLAAGQPLGTALADTAGGKPGAAAGNAAGAASSAAAGADKQAAKDAGAGATIQGGAAAVVVPGAGLPPVGPTAAAAAAAAAADAGAEPQIRRRLAYLFGEQDYAGKIPTLDTPASDVNAVADVLRQKFGYEVHVLRNATRVEIINTFLTLGRETSAEDSVLIYYAGHGYQFSDSRIGYWIPVDASVKDPRSWISNADIGRFLKLIPSRQVILVSDSCFSGSLAKEQRVTTEAAGNSRRDILSKRSVVVMTSGGEEPVVDEGKEGHSIFAWSLIKALEQTERSRVGVQLYESVRKRVVAEYPQQPQYGAAISAGHTQGGDYLFDRATGP